MLNAQSPNGQQWDQWHKIYNRAVSDDGKWIFYTNAFDNGKTEGILVHTKETKEFVISAPGKFYLDKHYLMVVHGKNELLLKDLTVKKSRTINPIYSTAKFIKRHKIKIPKWVGGNTMSAQKIK